MHIQCFRRLLEVYNGTNNIICPNCMTVFDNSNPLIAIPGSKSGLHVDYLLDNDLHEKNIILSDIPKGEGRECYFQNLRQETNDLKCCRPVLERKVVGEIVMIFMEHTCLAEYNRFDSVDNIKDFIVSEICEHSDTTKLSNQIISAASSSQSINIWQANTEMYLSTDQLVSYLETTTKLKCKKNITKMIHGEV